MMIWYGGTIVNTKWIMGVGLGWCCHQFLIGSIIIRYHWETIRYLATYWRDTTRHDTRRHWLSYEQHSMVLWAIIGGSEHRKLSWITFIYCLLLVCTSRLSSTHLTSDHHLPNVLLCACTVNSGERCTNTIILLWLDRLWGQTGTLGTCTYILGA